MSGLYIHVPFCKKRCLYCDFYSNTDMGYKKSYVESLLQEMELRHCYLEDPLETIYLGGGTPSQLGSGELRAIFEGISRYFPTTKEMEVTLEANPDDLTPEYVEELARLPINRVSMGIQSFDDADLKFLNRRHDRAKAIEAVRLLKEAGIGNISIDLIYGLPRQTSGGWSRNIDEALRLDVPHISAYHLIYEEGTPLYRLLEEGKVTPVDEESSVEFFSLLWHKLTNAGYDHYEISNFAKPGFYSRHNSSYWKGTSYLGLGPSAHSYNGKEREWNPSSLPQWIKGIRSGKPDIEYESLDSDTGYNDYIVTHLRTMWGVDLEAIRQQFGEERSAYLSRMAKSHLEQGRLKQEGGKLILTEAGIFVSDGIMSDLLWV